MKTYLSDILNKYKKFSETLDVKTILCNKSWVVLNNTDEKRLYIFLENYSLVTSVNGKLTKGTWEYIPINKSITISFEEASYMFHPLFMNGENTVLILQQDRTNNFICMIDENLEDDTAKLLEEVNSHFNNANSHKVEIKYNDEQEKEKPLPTKQPPINKEKRLSRKEKEDIERKEKWQVKRNLFLENLKKERLETSLANLKRQAAEIERQLNNSKQSFDIAKTITFKATDLNVIYSHEIFEIGDNERFRVNWICPNATELSLTIQSGNDILLYKNLRNIDNKIIEIPVVAPTIRMTLKAFWNATSIYKIVMLNKKTNK